MMRPSEVRYHGLLSCSAVNTSEFELEGHMLRAVSVGQGDTEASTVLHVPSAAAVVAGDVV